MGLNEITAVVDRLSSEDQRLLLEHLEANLAAPLERRQMTLAEVEEWMKELDALRDASRTSETAYNSDHFWDDLRADRA